MINNYLIKNLDVIANLFYVKGEDDKAQVIQEAIETIIDQETRLEKFHQIANDRINSDFNNMNWMLKSLEGKE